jgi:hypothetical protein
MLGWHTWVAAKRAASCALSVAADDDGDDRATIPETVHMTSSSSFIYYY